MSESTQTVEAPEATNESLLEGETQSDQTADSREESNDDLDPQALKKQLKEKQNREINLTKRLREAEAELKAHKDEKLSAAEKQANQLKEITAAATKREDSLKKLVLERHLESVKTEFGLRSTRSIAKLIDRDVLEFDVDDKLSVSGVEAELKRIKKEDPDLFIKGGADGGAGGTERGSSLSMNDRLRRAAGRG